MSAWSHAIWARAAAATVVWQHWRGDSCANWWIGCPGERRDDRRLRVSSSEPHQANPVLDVADIVGIASSAGSIGPGQVTEAARG